MNSTTLSSAGWIRRLEMAFSVQLMGLWTAGSWAAWARLDDALLRTTSVVAGVACLALACATFAPRAGALRNWVGPLQFIACWATFPLFKAIRRVLVSHPMDASLLSLDRWLWGGTSLPERMLGWEHPALSEVMSTAYLGFYGLVLVPVVAFALKRRSRDARAFFSGLGAMYLMGFTGYLLVPAAGPFDAFPAVFAYPPAGGGVTDALVGLVRDGATGMDVFPSLHAGLGVYVAGFLALSGRRWLAMALAPGVIVLVLSTVYLRYHYGIDVLFGLALAAVVLRLVSFHFFPRTPVDSGALGSTREPKKP